jgi:transcription initiation factor IIF auxiliary subunit
VYIIAYTRPVINQGILNFVLFSHRSIISPKATLQSTTEKRQSLFGSSSIKCVLVQDQSSQINPRIIKKMVYAKHDK